MRTFMYVEFTGRRETLSAMWTLVRPLRSVNALVSAHFPSSRELFFAHAFERFDALVDGTNMLV